MITLSNLAKRFGDRTLFEGVSMRLDRGTRYGLVGANGSGKTTLLKILAGDETASEGDVSIPVQAKVGVLRQDRYLSDEQTIIDVAMMGDRETWSLLREQATLLDTPDASAEAIADLEERVRVAGGYTLESRAATVLAGLGIEPARHHAALSTLSGGFKLRVLLAQTLVGEPDLLLLDEPTNHLDILTIKWLETFLQEYRGCVVVISHDHRFLDEVTSAILDVDYEAVEHYVGNYSSFVEQKHATRERKEAEIRRQEKVIAEKKAYIERFRYKATKARQAQSRLKQIDKIEIEHLVQSSRRAPAFRFEQTRHSGRDVLTATGVNKAYGDKSVLRDVSLTIRREERVALIGANGLGKSTLLKILASDAEADAGDVAWGYETHVGYFPQNHADALGSTEQSALQYLWEICPQEPTSFVRGQLGRMLFSGDDVDKKLPALSGGEAARLIFSRIIVQKPNVLMLDEPTNHLDLESIEALVAALKKYPGTLLFVSHDRWFVSELATRIVEIRPDGLRDFPGGYQAYLDRAGDDHLDADAVAADAKEKRRAEKAAGGQRGGDWQAQKKRRAERRKAEARRDAVTEAIDTAEKRVATIQERYCEAGFFESTPQPEVEALQAEEAQLGEELERLMEEWEALEEALETDDDEG